MDRPSSDIRPVEAGDLPAIQAIYAHHVLHGTASWELEPPDLAEMRRRCEALLEQGHPYLVACAGGEVLGYAYAGPYRPRPAYRFTVEDTIYLRHDLTGRDRRRQHASCLHRLSPPHGLHPGRHRAQYRLEIRPLAGSGAAAATVGRRRRQPAADLESDRPDAYCSLSTQRTGTARHVRHHTGFRALRRCEWPPADRHGRNARKTVWCRT